MEWAYIAGTHSTMLDEQWVLRHENRTLCSLRRSGRDEWTALLLRSTGIGTATLHIHGGALEFAKRDCVAELRLGGWALPEE